MGDVIISREMLMKKEECYLCSSQLYYSLEKVILQIIGSECKIILIKQAGMLLSIIGKKSVKLLSGSAKWIGARTLMTLRNLQSFSKMLTAMDFQKMKFEGVRTSINTEISNEFQTYSNQFSGERNFKTFVDNINDYNIPLQQLTSKKWLSVAQKFPYLFVKAQLKTMAILGRQLAEKIRRGQVTKDEALLLMEYIDDQVVKCYNPLQTLSEQMRQICEVVIDKNQSYLRFIYRISFCEDKSKNDPFLQSASYSQQKEIYLIKFMQSYKSQISKLQDTLNKAARKMKENISEEQRHEKKQLMLELIENLAECSFFYNEVVRQIYRENKHARWFMEIGEEVKNIMKNVLDLYKMASEDAVLTPIYILLKESKAKMEADLNFLELSAKKVTNEQVILLKENLAEEYEAIGRQALETVSKMNQKEINESKWLEIGLELIKIDLKSCKLKNMKLVEIHGSLFFKMEDFLGVIENDLIKKPLGKRLTEYINGQLEKIIEERARN